jgi:hypothetical protein
VCGVAGRWWCGGVVWCVVVWCVVWLGGGGVVCGVCVCGGGVAVVSWCVVWCGVVWAVVVWLWCGVCVCVYVCVCVWCVWWCVCVQKDTHTQRERRRESGCVLPMFAITIKYSSLLFLLSLLLFLNLDSKIAKF